MAASIIGLMVRLPRRFDLPASIGLLAFLAVLAYGPWASHLGFFRDDWYVLWAGRVYGASSIVEMFSIDRPVVGWLYSLTFSVFRDSAIAWQVYAIFLRWLGSVFALGLFRTLWPSRPAATTMAAILFLIYPGFLQQPNAMTFTNQLTTYLLAVASLTLTAWAVTARRRSTRVVLTVLALASSLGYQLLYEYMIGLEAARIAILGLLAWRLRAEPARRRVGWFLRHWLPYAGVIALNLVWRTFVFESERVATDLGGLAAAYAASPLRLLFIRFVELVKDIGEVLVGGWVTPLTGFADAVEYRPLAIAFIVAAAGVAGCLFAYRWIRQGDPPAEGGDGDLSLEMTLVGAVALVGSLLPVVFAGRDVRWESGFDRYSLHTTLGMSLLTVGLGLRLHGPRLRRAAAMGLVAVGLFTHFLNGSAWTDFWEAQRQLWWQLSWRAPQFESGTVLLAQLPVDGFYEDYEVWGPANLIYQPESGPLRVISEVFSEETAGKARLGLRDERGMRRIVSYPRDFNDVAVAVRPTVLSCVHLLDGRRAEFPPEASSLARALGAYSVIGRVDSAAEPPVVPTLFGTEPSHGWCYYYQQISLARQQADWAKAAEIAREVLRLELKPTDLSEWFPFLEAMVAAGDSESARQVSLYLRHDESLRHDLCDQVGDEPPPGFSDQDYMGVMSLLCTPNG